VGDEKILIVYLDSAWKVASETQ